MKVGDKQLIECSCHQHAIQVEVFDDEVDLISWEMTPTWHEGSLMTRVKQAWQILRGKNIAGAEIVLEKREALKLSELLEEAAEELSG